MPPAKFKLHEEAANEIRATKDWYLAKDHDAAQHFLDELNRALGRILSQPSMCARYLYSTRAVKLHRFRYVIVYKEIQGVVHIVALAHTSRRKGYWRRRLRDIHEP
jgi:toxin ParE1/3/4